MKKILSILLISIISIFCIFPLTGCAEILDIFEMASQNEILKEENQSLKEELATLKFEIAFPDGVIDESCILENVVIEKEDTDTEHTIYCIKTTGEDTEVVINGGIYNAGTGSASNVAVFATGASKVTINGGYFSNGVDVNGESSPVIYAHGDSIITINGGYFESTGDGTWLINCQNDHGTIIIKGGIFVNFDPSCPNTDDATSYVAEGYKVIEEIKDGVNYYTVVKDTDIEE